MRYVVVDGLRFAMLNEAPCAEPHAGCCGDWGVESPGYPIIFYVPPNIEYPRLP